MSTLLNAKMAQLEELRAKAMAQFNEFETKKMANGEAAPVISADELKELNDRRIEIDNLAVEVDALRKAHAASQPDNRPGFEAKEFKKEESQRGLKGIDFNGIANGWRKNFDVDDRELKTSVTTSAGWAPESFRTGEVVPLVYAKPSILDYLPMVPWNQQNYVWMAQTTRTNAAAAKSEVAAGDESTVAWTEQSATLYKVVGFLPVSEYALTFAPEMRRIVEQELVGQVREKLGAYCLTGSGTPPQWYGLNNLSAVGTEAMGSNPRLTAILNAMINVQSDASTSYGAAMPNLAVLNPADWQQIADTRTSDGIYIYGNPVSGTPTTIWGMNVLVTGQQTSGTGLVLDTNFFPVAYNVAGQLEFTNSHGELFAQGQLAFRSTIYATMVSKRDKACFKVTGI